MWQHLTTWDLPEWETKLWFCWLYLTYIFSLQDLTTPGFLSNFTFLLQIHGHLVIHISDVSEVSQSSFLLPGDYSSLGKAKTCLSGVYLVFFKKNLNDLILLLVLKRNKHSYVWSHYLVSVDFNSKPPYTTFTVTSRD